VKKEALGGKGKKNSKWGEEAHTLMNSWWTLHNKGGKVGKE